MSNILLAYGNKATGATLSGGQWESLLPLTNLKDGRLGKVARSSNQGPYATQFRFDLAANYVLRALALVNHNLTTNALWRLRTTEAAMDMDFVGPTSMRPRTLTTSGGANGTRVGPEGNIEAATCPRYDFSPVNLASGAATQTISNVPAGTYLLRPTGSNASVMASGSTVSNSGTIGTWLGPTFVVVTATGDVTLTVLSAATAIHFRESLGLLVEEARENLLLRSNALDTSPWLSPGSNVTVSSDATLFRGLTFWKLAKANTMSSANLSQTVAISATAGGYALTIALLAGNSTQVGFGLLGGVSSWGANTASIRSGPGTVSTASGYTTVTGLSTTTPTVVELIKTATAGEAITLFLYPGTPSSTTSGAYNYFCPMNVEIGSFSTSYIPTTSAAVTRTADDPKINSSNFSGFYNASEGTLYVEANVRATGATRGLASLNDNSGNNVIQLFTTSGDAPCLEVNNGAAQANIFNSAIAPGTAFKTAGVYKADDFAGCTNGGTVATDTSGAVPTVSQLNIGAINGATNQANGHIRRIAYWPTRRTNAELQSITTTGPDAIGIDTGWQNALRMTFHGDTPANWGEQYPLIATFDPTTVRYGTVEIEDNANPDNYVELGQLFVAGGFQPEHNAEYQGFGDGRTDLSSSVKSVGGQKYSTARRRPRTVDFNFPVLEQDEGDHLDEMMAEVGTTEDVLYVPDPADPAKSQRYGFLGTLRELTPLEYPFFDHRAMPLRLEQKL